LLTVSQAFQNAAKASNRWVLVRATTWLLDNSILSGFVEASGDENESLFGVAKVVNGETSPARTWALARDDCYPADDVYPIDADSEGGWFGDNVSDGNGDLGSSEAVTVQYATAQKISEVRVWGNTWLGYPVDFVVEYWDTDSFEWTEVANVSGNAEIEWSYTLPSMVETTKLRLTISRISRASDLPATMEFQGGLVVDLAGYIEQFDVVKERFYEQQGSIPIGNYGAGEINLTLTNTDGRFYSRNTDGPYYGYLKPNRKIELEIGFVTASGNEYVPAGTFYVVSWRAASGSPTCRVVARDRAKRLQGLMYEAAVQQDSTISELVTLLAAAAGLGETEYSIDATTYQVPYAIFERQSIWEHLRQVTVGEAGFIYFDEDGRLVFENRDHLADETVVQETLDDERFIVSVDDEVDEGRIRNYVRVTSKRRKEAASDTIWSLQETITIPGTGEWWSANYYRRRQVTIAAAAGNAISTGDGLRLEITGDTAAAIHGVCQSDGGDLRVVYDGGGGAYTECDRYLAEFSATRIVVYFKAQADIAAGSSDTDHWLYYYYPGATSPPDDGDNVFDIFDDFDRAAVGSDWTEANEVASVTWEIVSQHLACRPGIDTYDKEFCDFWNTVQVAQNFEVRCRGKLNYLGWPRYMTDQYGPCIQTSIAHCDYGLVYRCVGDENDADQVLIITPTGNTASGDITVDPTLQNWHTLRLVKQGTTWKGYLDGTLVVTRTGDSFAPTYFGVARDRSYIYPQIASYYDEWWVRFIKAIEPTITVGDLENKPTILTGENTVTIKVEFQGPAVDIQAPVITESGPDISVYSYSYNSTGGEVVLQNTGAEQIIEGMTIDGKLLEEDGQLLAEAENEVLVAEYGERGYTLDNDYIQDLAQAQAIADALLASHENPARQIAIQMPVSGQPHLQLGDRVAVQNDTTGIDSEFHIVRSKLTYDGGLHGELTCIEATD